MATTNSMSGTTPGDDRLCDLSSPGTWHKSAPKGLRKARSSDGKWSGWAAWGKHLAKRSQPASLCKVLPGRQCPLLWGLADGEELPQVPPGLIGGGRRRKKGPAPAELEKEILEWLSDAAGQRPQVRYCLEAIGWAHGLPGLASIVSQEAWSELLRHLVTTAIEANEVSLDGSPLVHQLLAGELAATLAIQLPEMVPCRKLETSARRALSTGLADLTDGRGFLHGRHLDRLAPLLACWTRVRAMAVAADRKPWNKAAERQYSWLVRSSLRLARADGTTAFAPSGTIAAAELLRAAVRQDGGKSNRRIAAWNLPQGKRKKHGRKPRLTLDLPDASVRSEWASAAVLRRTWQPASERLFVAYPDREVRMELAAGRDVFFSGVWGLDVQAGGQPAQPVDDWHEVCWFTDEDVDYLELQIDLAGTLRVQRHVLLARQQRFLLLADSILAADTTGIEYRGRLPLAEGTYFEPEAETRDGLLVAGRRKALVLPLALPEWRIDPRVGELVQTEGGLQLQQSTTGCGMMAPLFVDLAPRRATGPRTWRQLTVAESLETVASDLAVGYRAAVGRAQWLIYRSIGPKGNRSVLGQNFSNEMVVGRFRRSGETETLLHLE